MLKYMPCIILQNNGLVTFLKLLRDGNLELQYILDILLLLTIESWLEKRY